MIANHDHGERACLAGLPPIAWFGAASGANTTLLWNVVGTVVVIRAAIHTRSVALAGFSLRVRPFSDAAARLGPELA